MNKIKERKLLSMLNYEIKQYYDDQEVYFFNRYTCFENCKRILDYYDMTEDEKNKLLKYCEKKLDIT